MKTITLTALIFIFSMPVFCQKTALDDSTANRIVALFEFALDGSFDHDQRTAFVREVSSQWRSDANAAASYRKLLEIYEQIKTLPEHRQREAQAKFQEALLGEIEKNPTVPRNKILSAVYRAAHDDSVKSTVENAPTNRGGRIPPQLVGKWQTGSSSSTSYTNSATGASTGGGGTQVMYTIFADGRYEYASLYALTSYSCTTNTLLYKTGHIRLDGSQITFVPEGGKFTSEDNCNRQYNYAKPAKLDTETFYWNVLRDEYGTKICLKNSTIDGCAYKRD
jgi:hypothetical protein